MGVSRYTYLGPYIEVIYKKKEKQSDYCRSQSDCPNSKDPYCPKCGLDQSKRFHTYNVTPEFYSMFGDSRETLTPIDKGAECEEAGFMVENLQPNTSLTPRDFSGQYNWDSEDFNIEGEKDWMEKTFAKEIEILNEKFGKENVDVRWGYFTGWS